MTQFIAATCTEIKRQAVVRMWMARYAASRSAQGWQITVAKEGMTIAGSGASELGKLMREQHGKSGQVPHA